MGNRLCTEKDNERKIPKTEVEVNDKRGNQRGGKKKEKREEACLVFYTGKISLEDSLTAWIKLALKQCESIKVCVLFTYLLVGVFF